MLGLLLATVYGVTALVLQKQPLWFCAYSTVALAGLAAFGMGLSAGVRADVAVMLPSLCSGESTPVAPVQSHPGSELTFPAVLMDPTQTFAGLGSYLCGGEVLV